MKLNQIFKFICFAILVGFFTACEYEFVEPIKSPPIVPPGDSISFSLNIVPIWNNNNNCTSCHKGGGTPPDLTAGAAFSSITNLGLINSTTPENSGIYIIPAPTSGTHGWKKYTSSEAAAILEWIKDGAKNN